MLGRVRTSGQQPTSVFASLTGLSQMSVLEGFAVCGVSAG